MFWIRFELKIDYIELSLTFEIRACRFGPFSQSITDTQYSNTTCCMIETRKQEISIRNAHAYNQTLN